MTFSPYLYVVRCLQRLGLTPSTRLARWHFTFGVRGPITENTRCCVAVPPNTSQQQIRVLTWHSEPLDLNHDDKYQNNFAILDLTATTNLFTPLFSCEALIRPAQSIIDTTMASDEANEFIHPHNPLMREFVDALGTTTERMQQARFIYQAVTSRLTYGNPINDLYSDLDALRLPRVDCGGFASLFVSACLACNIPARLVSGFWLNGQTDMHAWAEWKSDNDVWIPVDPSVAWLTKRGRSTRVGDFGYIGSDRLTMSHGCDITIPYLDRVVHIPLLQHPYAITPDVKLTAQVQAKRV